MNNLLALYRSSVGKKIVMSLSGLFLCTFLVVHLSGNFLLFKNDGGVAFDAYSDFMSTNVVIRTMEIILFSGFIAHSISGGIIWWMNRRARPEKYRTYKLSENTGFASRHTMLTGSIVLVFLVIHLKTFWYGSRFAEVKPSMYQLVSTAFSSPSYVFFYLVALVLLGYHLRHGFQSAFQTLGLRSKKYIGLLDAVAVIFWLIIPMGFASMPVYFLWLNQRIL